MSIWTPRVSHSAAHCVAVGVLWNCAKLNIPPHTILISIERMQTYQISHFWDFFCFHEFPNWIPSKLFLILIIHIYCIARCGRGERQYQKRNSFDSLPPFIYFSFISVLRTLHVLFTFYVIIAPLLLMSDGKGNVTKLSGKYKIEKLLLEIRHTFFLIVLRVLTKLFTQKNISGLICWVNCE